MSKLATRPLPVELQGEHAAWVKELAFACWLAADRNASRSVSPFAFGRLAQT